MILQEFAGVTRSSYEFPGVQFLGFLECSLEFPRFSKSCQECLIVPKIFQKFLGIPGSSWDLLRVSRIFQESLGASWNSQKFLGFSRSSKKFQGLLKEDLGVQISSKSSEQSSGVIRSSQKFIPQGLLKNSREL